MSVYIWLIFVAAVFPYIFYSETNDLWNGLLLSPLFGLVCLATVFWNRLRRRKRNRVSIRGIRADNSLEKGSKKRMLAQLAEVGTDVRACCCVKDRCRYFEAVLVLYKADEFYSFNTIGCSQRDAMETALMKLREMGPDISWRSGALPSSKCEKCEIKRAHVVLLSQ